MQSASYINKAHEWGSNLRHSPVTIQPKLKVSNPDTIYKKQANEVANAVKMKPDSVNDEMVQMQQYKEEGETFQMKPFSGGIDYDIQMLLGSGSLQLKTEKSTESFHGIKRDALAGVTGHGIRLPYYNIIQPAFGKHDLSAVQCHFNSTANKKLGSEAYTIGAHICFANPPTLQTAAHEAAHVVQQKNGVSLSSGIGKPGDKYEKHADKVADTVAANRSAEGLLDQMARSGKSVLQSQSVQFWGGSEHYMMGNLAGNKALKMLKDGPENQLPTQVKTRTINLIGGTDPTNTKLLRHHDKEGETINIETNNISLGAAFNIKNQSNNNISLGAASRYSGDYDKTVKDLMEESKELDTVGWDFGAMAKAAATNSNHFFPLNHKEYYSKHKLALGYALLSRREQNQARKKRFYKLAIAHEGFALHFLQDSYASGHFAPRCLDAMSSWWETFNEARKGYARTKTWHDFFCMLPDGLPTSEGRFHGDWFMDSNDLKIVSDRSASSVYNVIAMALGLPVKSDKETELPKPDFNGIMADPVAGPPWRAMIGHGTSGINGYKTDLKEAKGRHTTWFGWGNERTYKTSGEVKVGYNEIISDLEKHTFGKDSGATGPAPSKENIFALLKAIQHYLSRDFSANIYTRLDDYMESKKSSNPKYNILELEKNFKMFSYLKRMAFAYSIVSQNKKVEKEEQLAKDTWTKASIFLIRINELERLSILARCSFGKDIRLIQYAEKLNLYTKKTITDIKNLRELFNDKT